MQVRCKNDSQVLRRERSDVFIAGGSSGAAHHARTKIDEIGGAVHHHGNRWSGTVRIDDGRARAKNYELGMSVLRKRDGRIEKEDGEKTCDCGHWSLKHSGSRQKKKGPGSFTQAPSSFLLDEIGNWDCKIPKQGDLKMRPLPCLQPGDSHGLFLSMFRRDTQCRSSVCSGWGV